MDNRILRYKDEFAALKRLEAPWPQMLTLFPVYGCNFHCSGCHYNEDNAEWKYVDVDVVLRRLAEMKALGLRGVSLCGGGEPTLHPRFTDLLDGIESLGLGLGCITNGTRMVGSTRIRERMLRQARFVRVSIWPETHIEATNALSLLPRSGEMGCRCLVSVKSLDLYRRVIPVLDRGGWDYIDVKAERESPHDPDSMGPEWLEAVMAELRALSPKVRGSLRKTSTQTKCYLSPVHAFVDADGSFMLCCFFQGRKQTHTFGSIHDDVSFSELWRGDAHRKARAGVNVHECNRWDCRFFGYMRVSEGVLAGADGETLTERDYFSKDDVFI